MAKGVRKGRAAEPKEPAGVEAKPKGTRTTALARREPWAQIGGPTNPFALMRRFAEEMDRFFEDFRLGFPRLDLPWWGTEAGEAAWSPPLEVVERGGNLVVRAELPGLTKDDVKVEVREDALAISGERRHEREEKRRGFYRSERTYGSFYREIPLPEGVDPEQAKASFKNGVLEVTVPAPPRAAKGRRIPIEAAAETKGSTKR
jgi:HSP20 family protein